MKKILSKKKTIYIGPELHYITGQSKSFSYLIQNNSNENDFFLNYTVERSFLKNLSFVFLFFSKLNKIKPDSVYLTISRSLLGFIRDSIIIHLSFIFNCKIIVHLHGSDLNQFIEKSNSILRKFILFTYSKIDHYIILSESMKDQLKYFSEPNFSSVVNAVDNDLYKVQSLPCNKVFTFTYMSNLIPEKGLEVFLVFFGKKYGNNDNYNLLICGKNGYNKKLDDLVSYYTNKFNNIFYLGVVSGTRKTLVMSVTSCVVLLSRYRSEAQPICILEGYVIGVPVLAYSYKYINDLVNINNGYICDYLTENELNKAVLHIESNYNVISDYNKSISDGFTVENFILNIKNIIDNV